MSGHKSAVVTISQEEYRRLYESERNLYYESMAHTNLERENEIENQVRDLAYHIEDRESRFLNLIQNFDQDLRNIEENASQELMVNQMSYLEEIILDQKKEIENNVADGKSRDTLLNQKMENFLSGINQKFAEYHQSLSNRFTDEEEIGRLVEDYIGFSDQLIDIIQNSFPGHIVGSAVIDKVKRNLALVNSNLDHGAIQSALNFAQSAYLALSDEKRACDQKYLEWQLLNQKVITDLELMKMNFTKNRNIQPINKNGQLIGDEINTNYWTQGEFNELEQNVLEMISYLADKGSDTSSQELKTIENEFIQPIQDLIIKNLMDARINALNAQIRYEIANTVLVALVEQGFKPISGDYADGNFLDSYQASAVNSSGNQVDISVEPGPTNNIENSLHVISSISELTTQDELQSRAQEIRKSLVKHGLEIEKFIEIPKEPLKPASSIQQPNQQFIHE